MPQGILLQSNPKKARALIEQVPSCILSYYKN